MRTVGYYGGEKVTISGYDPDSEYEMAKGEPDERATAPEPTDGDLLRYGNVIVTTKSRKRFKLADNEAAVRVMQWAKQR